MYASIPRRRVIAQALGRVQQMVGRKQRGKEIQESIRGILLTSWDPLRVAGEQLARDEYDGFIVGVYRLLASHAPPERVAQHLRTMADELLGPARRVGDGELQVAYELCALDVRLRRPPQVAVREALAGVNPACAVLELAESVSDETEPGARVRRCVDALLAVNSSGAKALFMTEWLYARIGEIRNDLHTVGATASLLMLDEIREKLRGVPGAEERPDVVILTPEFEAWERAATPTSDQLADEIERCTLAYASAHVDQLA